VRYYRRIAILLNHLSDRNQINYSRVFKELAEANIKLVFDVMVISEVINRALRIHIKNPFDDLDL